MKKDVFPIRQFPTRWIRFAMLAMIAIVWSSSVGCQPKEEGSNNNPANVSGPDDGNDPEEEVAKPLEATFTETIPPSLVDFEMVLVPVSEDSDETPFYIGKTEVTWDEFEYWALCKDIKEKKAILEREKKLRPSAPHDIDRIYRGWGSTKQPVVGVSRLAAERYCDWLSEQTGKTYRLPTPTEWDRAFVAGGGTLAEVSDKNALKEVSWFVDNTFDDETFDNRAMQVAKKQPNKLGIHDMLGNVAEWVSGDEDKKVARGGSFLTKASELTGNHTDVEDQAVWNKNYPNEPKSLWWYVDADYVGFRVVCDAK
ncbi:MAG: SUMF1/EgtB/PvdO family nonheme iron enzyme [Planctomycetota bacterium]